MSTSCADDLFASRVQTMLCLTKQKQQQANVSDAMQAGVLECWSVGVLGANKPHLH